jgi:hypothetical protein
MSRRLEYIPTTNSFGEELMKLLVRDTSAESVMRQVSWLC